MVVSFEDPQVRAGLLERGLGDLRLATRRIERVLRLDPRLVQALGEAKLPLTLLQLGLVPLDRRLGPLDLGLVVARLEPGDDIPFSHLASFLHLQVAQAALDLCRDDGLLSRDDVPGGGQDRKAGASLAWPQDLRPGDLYFGDVKRVAHAPEHIPAAAQTGENNQKREPPAPGRSFLPPVNSERGEVFLEVAQGGSPPGQEICATDGNRLNRTSLNKRPGWNKRCYD